MQHANRFAQYMLYKIEAEPKDREPNPTHNSISKRKSKTRNRAGFGQWSSDQKGVPERFGPAQRGLKLAPNGDEVIAPPVGAIKLCLKLLVVQMRFLLM